MEIRESMLVCLPKPMNKAMMTLILWPEQRWETDCYHQVFPGLSICKLIR